MPKTINHPYWGTIPMQGPRSYSAMLNSEEVKQLREFMPDNAEWLEPNPAITNQKSFYHRAYVEYYIHPEHGTCSLSVLYSYGTPVAAIAYPWDNDERRLFRLWDDWSATTSKHVQSFFGVKLSKREWLDMEVFNRCEVEAYALNRKSLYY